MIVLALDDNLDPALVSDLLREAGFKVIEDPSAAIAAVERSLDGSLKRAPEGGAAPIGSDTVTLGTA
jgi:hypothetical protein